MQLTDADQQECLHKAEAAGAACRLAMHFLPAPTAARVLAREALIQSIRSIPREVRDPGVALAKLAWWQRELERAVGDQGATQAQATQARATQASAHPVVRALQRSGALQDFNLKAWSRLLEQAVEQHDAPIAGSLELWLGQMLDAARAEAGLHLTAALPHAEEAMPEVFLGVAAALVVRLLELTSAPQASYNWLPLDLLAAQACSAAELQASSKLHVVISQLAGAVQDRWLPAQARTPVAGVDTRGCLFLQIRGALARRQLRAWSHKPAAMQRRAGQLSPLDVLLAWKLARRRSGIPGKERAD